MHSHTHTDQQRAKILLIRQKFNIIKKFINIIEAKFYLYRYQFKKLNKWKTDYQNYR